MTSALDKDRWSRSGTVAVVDKSILGDGAVMPGAKSRCEVQLHGAARHASVDNGENMRITKECVRRRVDNSEAVATDDMRNR